MPSPPRSAWLTTERRVVGAFIGSTALVCATWFFGVSLRAPIWDDNVARLTNPGLAGFFPGLDSMFGMALIISLGTAGYLGCLWALRRGFRHSFVATIVACGLAAASWLPAAPVSSPDAVHLAADVRTFWLHGKFPAQTENAPSQIDDPIARQVVAYRENPSGYGPVAYAVGGIPLPLVGDGIRLNLMGLKVLAGMLLVASATIAGWISRRSGGNAGLVAAFIGLNPLMLWQFPGDGHNDMIMVTLGLLSLPLLLSTQWSRRAGGLVFAGLATLAKFGLAVAAPVVVASWFPKYRAWLAIAVVALGIPAVVYVFGQVEGFGLGTIGPARAVTSITPWRILWNSADRDPDVIRWINVVSYSGFVLIAGLLTWKHPLRDDQDVIAAIGTAVFLFLFTCPGALPWYQAWYLPFAILSGRRWLILSALVFSVGIFLPLLAFNYTPFIERDMGISDPREKATVVLWLAVGITALLTYRADMVKAEAPAPDPRRAARAAPRRAIRQRR